MFMETKARGDRTRYVHFAPASRSPSDHIRIEKQLSYIEHLVNMGIEKEAPMLSFDPETIATALALLNSVSATLYAWRRKRPVQIHLVVSLQDWHHSSPRKGLLFSSENSR